VGGRRMRTAERTLAGLLELLLTVTSIDRGA